MNLLAFSRSFWHSLAAFEKGVSPLLGFEK